MDTNNNLVGANVARLREKAGMSQSELAQLLYISPQAISRWERGGLPETSMLPKLATVLNCSIDDLFSMQRNSQVNAEYVLDQFLTSVPEEMLPRQTFELFWNVLQSRAAILGGDFTSGALAMPDSAQQEDGDLPMYTPRNYYMDLDKELIQAAALPNCKYFLYMQEPQDGFSGFLKDAESYRKFFALLGKPHYLETLLLSYTLPRGQLFSSHYIANRLNISTQEAQAVLDDLCDHSLLDYRSVQMDETCMSSYRPYQNTDIVPLLYFAGNFFKSDDVFNLFIPRRQGPLLKNTPPATSNGSWAPTSSKDSHPSAPFQHCSGDANFD